MQKLLPKAELAGFINTLLEKYTVIGPVKKGNTKFDFIKSPKQLYLSKITQVPVKKFFLPDNETILTFKDNKISEPKDKTSLRIIFGLRKCDLNALQVLDLIMKDPLYIMKRRKTILIGMGCNNPDKYCFCNSMDLKEGDFDLFFYPAKNHYFISIGSKKGLALVKNLKNAKIHYKPKIKNTKILINKEIERFYKDKAWLTDSDKCLSCSACTVYCPTCNCFDIFDSSDINLKQGSRKRSETSCQLQSFSRVAGDKIFRQSRPSRFKHFVYHKIDYFKKQYKRFMCVGCGRCLRVCPTKIDWVETLNLLGGMRDEKSLI
jgi:ferredoxin